MFGNNRANSSAHSLPRGYVDESGLKIPRKIPTGYHRWNSTRATCDSVNDECPFSPEGSLTSGEKRLTFSGLHQPECVEEDWSYVWKRLRPYSRHIISRPNILLGSPMEKDPCCLPILRVYSPVGRSWIWEDDPKEVKTLKTWGRSYSEFMQSPYYPVKLPSLCLLTRKHKQRQASAIKCRAWLNAHRLWMSK